MEGEFDFQVAYIELGKITTFGIVWNKNRNKVKYFFLSVLQNIVVLLKPFSEST